MFDAREKRVEVFQDTMKLCKENAVLADAIKNSIQKTKFYPVEDEILLDVSKDKKGVVSVSKDRSFQAAFRLRKEYPNGKIAVHNFASATNPGGGVEHGSSAQEEALCRCSTLFPCLKTKELMEQFYYFHRYRKDMRYTDACIYTPGVVVMKSDTDFPETLPENEWNQVDIITCAAPNLRERPCNSMNPGNGESVKVSDRELLELHKSRGEKILRAAAKNGANLLVLGAFGCGAFCNNPEVVAKAYKEVLCEYAGYFDEVVFAVYCTQRGSKNYDAFLAELS